MRTHDALFLDYYEDIDRWFTEAPPTHTRPSGSPAELIDPASPRGNTILARSARQAVTVDGATIDHSRFLSLAAHGTTAEYRRYDPFSITHLAGKYYESLALRHGYSLRHVNVVTRIDLERLAEEIAPRWIMLSSTFMTEIPHLLDALSNIRRAFPGVPICVGGLFLVEIEKALTPLEFQRLLMSLRTDVYAVTPLGEATFLELLRSETSSLDPARLPGSFVRDGRRYTRSDAPEPGLTIDDTWVRWDEVDQSSLYHMVHSRTARSRRRIGRCGPPGEGRRRSRICERVHTPRRLHLAYERGPHRTHRVPLPRVPLRPHGRTHGAHFPKRSR